MGKVYSPEPSAGPLLVAIAVAKFNEAVTERLLEGALEALARITDSKADADVYWVPGAFELPALAQRLCDDRRYSGVLTLGALIKGDTDHYEVLARSVTDALQSISCDSKMPLCFGVLTCQNLQQAFERAGGKHGNKGAEAMESLLRMHSLYVNIEEDLSELYDG